MTEISRKPCPICGVDIIEYREMKQKLDALSEFAANLQRDTICSHKLPDGQCCGQCVVDRLAKYTGNG